MSEAVHGTAMNTEGMRRQIRDCESPRCLYDTAMRHVDEIEEAQEELKQAQELMAMLKWNGKFERSDRALVYRDRTDTWMVWKNIGNCALPKWEEELSTPEFGEALKLLRYEEEG